MENKEEIIEKLNLTIKNLEEKNFKIFFFVMDTKGSPNGAVANIYELVTTLRGLGYEACILHEKADYTKVGGWLAPEYDEIPHYAIENQQLKVNGEDFIIIPEIFSNVMEQTANIPSKRVVFCQSYDYILEMLLPGKNWADYGIKDCITTTEEQKNYINDLFSGTINTEVIPVSIPEYFKPSDKPKKPFVAIYTRDQRDTVKIFKTFYLKYPHLKWVTFRDMRGMSKEVFAKNLSECMVTVWVDDISGFGTLPVESMKCDVPVIGKVPELQPSWMKENNGVWVNNVKSIPDILANYVQAWLEDREPKEIYEGMAEIKNDYTVDQQKQDADKVFGTLIENRLNEYKEMLEKQNNVTEKIES